MNRPWTSGGKRDQDAIAATGALVRERVAIAGSFRRPRRVRFGSPLARRAGELRGGASVLDAIVVASAPGHEDAPGARRPGVSPLSWPSTSFATCNDRRISPEASVRAPGRRKETWDGTRLLVTVGDVRCVRSDVTGVRGDCPEILDVTGADDASRLGVEHSADDQAFVDSVSVWPEE